jgi:hypothetical protein
MYVEDVSWPKGERHTGQRGFAGVGALIVSFADPFGWVPPSPQHVSATK